VAMWWRMPFAAWMTGRRGIGANLLLQQADSLGRRIETARQSGAEAPQDLLRRAERIQREAWIGTGSHVPARRLSRTGRSALSACSDQIAALDAALRSGRGSRESAAELRRLQEARTRLESSRTGPSVLPVPPAPA